MCECLWLFLHITGAVNVTNSKIEFHSIAFLAVSYALPHGIPSSSNLRANLYV